MTNTVSEFGRELDSLADVITFGIAPAVLAFVWGVQFVQTTLFGRILQPRVAVRLFHFVFYFCAALHDWLGSTFNRIRC